MSNNPHLLRRYSLFAMFCLSYFPLFLLITIKVLVGNKDYLNFGGFNTAAVITFLKKYGFVVILIFLSVFAFVGTALTFKNVKTKKSNAFPVNLKSVKLKNEEALSYLATYVIPLLIRENIGLFEYATFIILFIIYYMLYSTSSLILINPILNMKYGLYEIDYNQGNENTKNAMIISEHQQLEENQELKILKLSHRLYFAF